VNAADPGSAAAPSSPAGVIGLLLLALLLYGIFVAPLADLLSRKEPSHGDAAFGDAWAMFIAMAAGAALWLVLAGLLRNGATRGEMPQWAALGSGILLPLSALVGVVTLVRSNSYPGGLAPWTLLLLPPLFALYALWARFPAVHGVLPPKPVSVVALVLIGLLIVASLPLSFRDETQAGLRARNNWQERYQRLTPDDSLESFLYALAYLYPAGDPARAALREQGLARAAQSKSRQDDAVRMLNASQLDLLTDMWRLSIEPTPELCDAYGNRLQKFAESAVFNQHSMGIAGAIRDIVPLFQAQLPNMRWLAGAHCDLDPALTAITAAIQGDVTSWSEQDRAQMAPFLAALAELRQPHN
jgi:hypothetical protein